MDINVAGERLWAMDSGGHFVFYTGEGGTQVTVERTDRVCPHDFAVGLVIPGRSEFHPTHIRLLFDLYLKRLSDPSDARKLFGGLDLIYKGEDPVVVSPRLKGLRFSMQLDDPDINLYCAQLLMIE